MHTPTSDRTPRAAGAETGDLGAIAAATPENRNRAVDFYRAVSMGVVAVGHWLGMVMVLGRDGELVAGNALDHVPSLWWVTWIGQVVPLFFFVGGFASATSLRSAQRKGTRSQDWVAQRLRRMLAPTALLAVFWAGALTIGVALGHAEIVGAGAYAAAIPLWFLANYTIDIAAAPFTFRWYRRSPATVFAALFGIFAACETARFAGVPYLPELNWVIGWLLFQITGYAWQDGRLPTGGRLVAVAVTLWSVTIAAVALGPWPATMLHHGGIDHSPTHPPSAAFLLFGFAYCATATALAPAVNRWLVRSRRAWTRTVAANAVAMSVYLWHMTAAVMICAGLYATGNVPRVDVGSWGWWVTKPPIMAASALVLGVIVRRVMHVERRSLLAAPVPWRGGVVSITVTAAVLSAGVKMWSAPDLAVLAAGVVLTVLAWYGALRPRSDLP